MSGSNNWVQREQLNELRKANEVSDLPKPRTPIDFNPLAYLPLWLLEAILIGTPIALMIYGISNN